MEVSSSLKDDLEQVKMLGWYEDLGGIIVGQGSYNIIPKPEVSGLPDGQRWTTLNLPKKEELEKALIDYEKSGLKNNIVLTLQACSVGRHVGFSDDVSDVLSAEGHSDLSSMVDKGKSQEIILALGTCSYCEHLAWLTGKVEGLANPNGLLVSMLIITSDHKLIFAKRDRVSAGRKKIGVIGGTYDYGTNEKVPHPLDIAYGEVIEELGVKRDDASIRLLTLAEDRYKRPVLLYRATLGLDAKQVEGVWGTNFGSAEHSKLYFVDNTLEGVLNFAKEHPPADFHPPADLIFQQALMQKISEKKEEDLRWDDMAAGSTPF